ncbi:MAG: hypothetical protein ACO1SV_27565 [Fimbriimonas sp.]
MSGLLEWLDTPVAAPKAIPTGNPVPDVRWPGNQSTRNVRSLARGLEVQLQGVRFEEGDAADRALELVRLWLAAIDDHPKHGLNWLGKHRDELLSLLRVALPGLLPPDAKDKPLEGNALAKCALKTFPGAWQGAIKRPQDPVITSSWWPEGWAQK